MAAVFMPEHVQRIAALANLELQPSEIELFARQLSEFLAYADQVLEVDTAGVAPTASVMPRHQAERDDRIAPSLDRRDVLANAPEAAVDAGLFKVPRVLG